MVIKLQNLLYIFTPTINQNLFIMKFRILLLVAIMAVSCGKLSDKEKDTVGSLSGETAGGLITYNNAMIDYMNKAGDKIDATAKDYDKMSAMVTQKRKPRMFMGIAFIGSSPTLEKFLLEPENSLPSDVKEKLVGNMKSAAESFENTKKAYADFKTYLDNEDFKDDDWSKGKEYTDIIEKNITNFYDQRSEAYKTIKPLADAAEIELLKDHPLRETILATKQDLKLAEEILNIVFAKKVDIDALNTKYTELENNAKKHRVLTPELLKEQGKKRFYVSFYEELDDFLGELRKDKRDGQISKSDADDVQRGYGHLIDDYNRFM